MSVSNIVRNLRDGELVIKDGTSPTPLSLTLLLDEGDLSWTQRTQTLEIKDRGSIAAGHTRRGDDESVVLSFSTKWTQLLGNSVEPADALQLYEFLMFTSSANVASTSGAGQQETLRLEFTVTDPAGVAGERIVFDKVYRESLTMSEGDDFNLISFRGRDFETVPSISRV